MARTLRLARQTLKRRSGREGGPSVHAGRRVARGLEAVPRSPPERKEPVCVIAVEGGQRTCCRGRASDDPEPLGRRAGRRPVGHEAAEDVLKLLPVMGMGIATCHGFDGEAHTSQGTSLRGRLMMEPFDFKRWFYFLPALSDGCPREQASLPVWFHTGATDVGKNASSRRSRLDAFSYSPDLYTGGDDGGRPNGKRR